MTQQDDPPPDGHPNWRPPRPVPSRTKAHRLRFPRWRIFTWVILAFNLIMMIWVITGISSNAKSCSGLTGNALTDCQAGNVGTGIGVGLVFIFWALGDVILGVLWLVTRPRTRICPACGNNVRRGMTRCPACGQRPPGENTGPEGS